MIDGIPIWTREELQAAAEREAAVWAATGGGSPIIVYGDQARSGGEVTADLAAWLTMIWDEEERLATEASPSPWHLNDEHSEVLAVDDIEVCTAFALSNNQLRWTARHIAYHDPASVLARIAADRKILALHKIDVRKIDLPLFDELTGERQPDHYDVICRVCGWAAEDPTSACETVRLLASPYKGREGWQEEWE